MNLKLYKWNNTYSVQLKENEYCCREDSYIDYKGEPITGIAKLFFEYLLYINGEYITKSSKPLKETNILFNKIIKERVFK